jgi:hypothetical protein
MPGSRDSRLKILGMDHLRFIGFFNNYVGLGHRLVWLAAVHGNVGTDILDVRVLREICRRRNLLVQCRRVRSHRRFTIENHRKRLILYFDLFKRLLQRGLAVSRDRGYRVAHVADFVPGEHVSVVSGAPVLHVRGILRRDYGVHAGERLSLARVDGLDPGVGILAAQDPAANRVGKGEVDAVDTRPDDPFHTTHPWNACA